MRRVSTSSIIALAQGRAWSYVVNGIGPRPPGAWHRTQRASTMRAMSPVHVTRAVIKSCAPIADANASTIAASASLRAPA